MKTHRFALTVLTLTLLALIGCSGSNEPGLMPDPGPVERTDGDHPAEITETPAPSNVVHEQIPKVTREAHFPYSEPEFLNWLSDVPAAGPSAISRRVLPCDDAALPIGIDRRVLDYAEVVFEQDGYLISRQMTLYPDTATAEKFVRQLSESTMNCKRLMGSNDLGSVQRLDYGRDRFFDTRDKSVVFSETDLTYGEVRFLYLDVINQMDNAIVFTRIGKANPDIKGSGVLMDKAKNAGFVRQVRAQADRATAILIELLAH